LIHHVGVGNLGDRGEEEYNGEEEPVCVSSSVLATCLHDRRKKERKKRREKTKGEKERERERGKKE
jgi:hypothetical protein